jgi:hypothetical protein
MRGAEYVTVIAKHWTKGLIVVVEASFSSGTGSLLMNVLDGDVELVKGGAKRARQLVVGGE